jgi:putative membrane protein
MTKWLRTGGAALVLAFVATAGAQQPKDEDKPLTDAEFVKKAASANMHEIELGKIAKERATDPDVKKLAEKMVTDHTKVLDDLKELAKGENIPVPEMMSDEHKKHVDMLRDYKGTDFDKTYVKHAVEDHEASVKLFTKAGRELKNEKLKAFAEKTLPAIKDHLDMAKKINERLDRK